MLCYKLSNKKSCAPFLYLALQIILLIVSSVLCPILIDFVAHIEMIMFWVNVLLTIISYFLCHWRDPGYVPYDAVFFTEQDESCRSESKSKGLSGTQASCIKIELINDCKTPENKESCVKNISDVILDVNQKKKLFQKKSKFMNKDLRDKSPRKKHPIRNKELIVLEKTMDQMGQTQNLLNLYKDQNNTHNDNNAKDDNNHGNNDADESNARKIQENIVRIDSKLNNPQCEPSIQSDSSFSQYDSKSSNCARSSSQNLGDRLNQLEDKDDIEDSEKIKLDLMNPIDCHATILVCQICQSRTEENNMQEQAIDNINKQNKGKLTLVLPSTTTTTNCNTRQQTGDEEQIKLAKIQDNKAESNLIFQKLNEQSIKTQNNGNLIRSFKKRMSCSPQPIKVFDTIQDNAEPPASERIVSPFNQMNEIKIGISNQNSSYQKPIESNQISIKIDENMFSETLIKPKTCEEYEIIYVERRYCTICNIEQPIRARHCKICQRCCASYDHHCPWLGTCIGEKNHLLFYWFLFFQFVENTWGATIIIIHIMYENDEKNQALERYIIRIVLACIASFFTIMVGLLLGYHSYLMLRNMTTWEHLSWRKISYLNDWPKERGPPFSLGFFTNLKYFCCESKKDLQRWRLPKLKKSINMTQKSF